MKILFLLFTFVTFLFAEVKTVIVTGYGISKDKAIKNSTKQAIQQVVGMYTVSDEIIKNDELIKDEVLSSSNGFVKTFKLLKAKQDDGMWEVDAQVDVELGKVIKRLEDLNIVTKQVTNSQFKAISLSKIKNTKDFKKVAKKVIWDPILESKKVYETKIISLKPVNEDSILFKTYERTIGNYVEKGLYPFAFTYSIRLDPNYYESVKQFVEHTAKECSTRKFDKKVISFYDGRINESRSSLKADKLVYNCRFDTFKFAQLKSLKDKYNRDIEWRWNISLLDANGDTLSELVDLNPISGSKFYSYRNKKFSIDYMKNLLINDKKVNYIYDLYIFSLYSSDFQFYYVNKPITITAVIFLDESLVENLSSIKIEMYNKEK